MEKPFRKFYDHVKKLLETDAEITSLGIPVGNIRPSNDVTQPEPGIVIQYGWTSGSFNRRSKFGIGTFDLAVGSPDSKVSALDILEILRGVLTPKKLTAADTQVIVHKFNENDAVNDEQTRPSSRLEAETDFDVRLVEVQ